MKRLGAAFYLLVVGCTVGPTVPKGQVTVQGRGSEALTNQGDPLLMNDHHEVTFGLHAVAQLFEASERIRAACGSSQRFQMLRNTFIFWFNKFVEEHLPNTFVLCFCEHAPDDNDGLLPMWR